MASRVQTFIQRPWAGGLNTASDASLISPDELQVATNTLFTTDGARRARGAFKLFDYIATGVSRYASATTRTIIVSVNSGFSFSVSDQISVESGVETEYQVKEATLTAVDTVTYSPNVALTYEVATSLTEGSAGSPIADTSIRVGKFEDEKIIGIQDYWYFASNQKNQKIVAVTEEGNFFEISTSGSKTPITTSGLSLTTPIAECSFAVLGEKLLIAFSGVGNKPVIYDGTSAITHVLNQDFDGNNIDATNPTPDIHKVRVSQRRVYGIDKTDPDRIVYSEIDEPRSWNGEGTSGAILFPGGDGDSEGLSAILPEFKSVTLAGKGNQMHRLNGVAPSQSRETISEGIGAIAHNACVAVDQDDVLFISRRGIHSAAATDSFGDFQASFISNKIQPDFNAFNRVEINRIYGAYFSRLNSVVFAAPESGQTVNNVMYLYNLINQGWYVWKPSDATIFTPVCLEMIQLNNEQQMLSGTARNRILFYDEEETKDFFTDDIVLTITTGIIYPDQNPTKIKGIKEVGVLYKSGRSDISFDLSVKVDNFSTQTRTATDAAVTALLGVDFILGSSILGTSDILLPFNADFSGYGYGVELTIETSSDITFYGYTIDFEGAGDQQDVDRGGSA
jgi:hypothetical protein